MHIKTDNLKGPEIASLLDEHLGDMNAVSPPESKHALDLEGLRQPDITFWTLWEGAELAGCGALKELSAAHGEIKSMRTSSAFRRRGVAVKLLHHIIDEARRRGYQRLSLETGRVAYFEPARKLYTSFGFENCAPFGDYKDDPNSVFMTKDLEG
jgi:putative acetyltransferase